MTKRTWTALAPLLVSLASCAATAALDDDDGTLATVSAPVLQDGDDPFEAPARVLADELKFTFGVQHAPWMGTSWESWNTTVAQRFNSFTNLGALQSITERDAVNREFAALQLGELGWAISDANNTTYYNSAQPFHSMRGHTGLWYGAGIPQWFTDYNAACPGSSCLLDTADWCAVTGAGVADCNITGMPLANPAATLREVTLRRLVWRELEALRSRMGASARLQFDVANEIVDTVFPWESTAEHNKFIRQSTDSDATYFSRIFMALSGGDSHLWSNIRPSDPLYFLELAFKVARAADARVRLFLNDYDLDGVGMKSTGVRETAIALRARGADINGIGMQMHLREDYLPGPYDHLTKWSSNLQESVRSYMAGLAPVGVETAITEFDYTMTGATADEKDVLLRHARAARALLDACIDSGNCWTFIAWGAIEDASVPTGDNARTRGTLRHDYSTLPAYRALEKGFARAVVPGSTVIEPEWLPWTAGATSGGQSWQEYNLDGYIFFSNGSFVAPVMIPVTGTYVYDVFGIGYPAAGQNPFLDLKLDSTTYGTLSVVPGYQHYKPTFVLPAGSHTATVAFTNDYYANGEDRNALIDTVVIRPKHRVGRESCHSMPIVDFGVKDSASQDSGWAIAFGNGGFREAVSVTRTGWYVFRVRAYGFGATSNETVDVRIDGQTQTTWSLVNQAWGSPGTDYEVQVYMTRGTHELGVWFTNDYYEGGQDRNVAFKTFDVCPTLESSGGIAYSASNTNFAQQNTTNVPVFLYGGQTLTAGVCASGASFSGDTYLRVTDVSGVQQVSNDDSCGFGSQVAFTAPVAGTYWIKMGCYSSGTCSGNALWSVQ